MSENRWVRTVVTPSASFHRGLVFGTILSSIGWFILFLLILVAMVLL